MEATGITVYLINEDTDQSLGVINELLNPLKHLLNQLPTLVEKNIYLLQPTYIGIGT